MGMKINKVDFDRRYNTFLIDGLLGISSPITINK
jgi:hypothetical protein